MQTQEIGDWRNTVPALLAQAEAKKPLRQYDTAGKLNLLDAKGNPRKHGVLQTYRRGCRCQECRVANAAMQREARRRAANAR